MEAKLLVSLLSLACTSPIPDAPAPVEARKAPALDRGTFNQLAAEADLGVFWFRDDDGVVDADEIVRIWGSGAPGHPWTDPNGLTDAFHAAYGTLAAARDQALSDGPPGSEARRQRLVLEELRQARPTLIHTDLAQMPGASPEDAAFVAHILDAAVQVERLFAAQRGADRFASTPPTDAPSRALFRRNQGPWCAGPQTRDDPDCSALSARPPKRSGLYPEDLQADPAFCEALPESVLSPFTAVRRIDGDLAAVPFHEAWPETTRAAHDALTAAAAALGSDEQPLRAYVEAAASAFLTDDWFAADEAWAAMSATNSKWYLRIGPDETYFEPCDRKAGYHVSFARLNPGSVAWQRRLQPVKGDMEKRLAELAGPPYAAREVAFSLPDFIDVVINAGDARRATGATIGQSLPNWGPVANDSRGRTVAMTNLGQDADSVAALKSIASALLCTDTMADWAPDPEPLVMSTVLHEAAHNLGPSAEYRVDGKTDEEAFGGDLSSTLEELKAQTAAMLLYGWLAQRGEISHEMARQARVQDLIWGFGEIHEGLFDGDDSLTYGQLMAVQLGFLLEADALVWRGEDKAANGEDTGCFSVRAEAWDAGVEALARAVLGVKSRNDAVAGRALVDRHVTGEGAARPLLDLIRERYGRQAGPSYVYAVTGAAQPK